MIRLALDFAHELAEVTVLTACRKRLGIFILEARINLLERQIDLLLKQARHRDVLRRRAG
jgi:hypothetical protein